MRHIKTLLRDVNGMAAAVSAPGVQRPVHYTVIMQLFSRCRDTYSAMLDLIARSFGHEATLFARPLFTESLMLGHLAARNERDRASLVIGWWMRSLTDLDGVYRIAESMGEDVQAERAAVAERRKVFERYARRHGAATKTWKPNEAAMARAQGRERDLVDFEFANLFVHGGARILEARGARHASGELAIWARSRFPPRI